jgi:hypothetical protein
MSDEPKPWWEAVDDIDMGHLPKGNAMTIALLPFLSLDRWRKSQWPDRPHP